MEEERRSRAGRYPGEMGRAFRGVGALIPPRTPEQRQQNRHDVRLLVPVIVVTAAVVGVVAFVLSRSVLVTALAILVAYVIVMPVMLAVLLRRDS